MLFFVSFEKGPTRNGSSGFKWMPRRPLSNFSHRLNIQIKILENMDSSYVFFMWLNFCYMLRNTPVIILRKNFTRAALYDAVETPETSTSPFLVCIDT